MHLVCSGSVSGVWAWVREAVALLVRGHTQQTAGSRRKGGDAPGLSKALAFSVSKPEPTGAIRAIMSSEQTCIWSVSSPGCVGLSAWVREALAFSVSGQSQHRQAGRRHRGAGRRLKGSDAPGLSEALAFQVSKPSTDRSDLVFVKRCASGLRQGLACQLCVSEGACRPD